MQRPIQITHTNLYLQMGLASSPPGTRALSHTNLYYWIQGRIGPRLEPYKIILNCILNGIGPHSVYMQVKTHTNL